MPSPPRPIPARQLPNAPPALVLAGQVQGITFEARSVTLSSLCRHSLISHRSAANMLAST